MSGDTTKIKTVQPNVVPGTVTDGNQHNEKGVVGEDGHETPQAVAVTKENVKAEVSDQQPATLPEPRIPQWKVTLDEESARDEESAVNSEFVDNFVELIKAHGRLFHHSVVIRGQEEVGMPGADVKEVEEALRRSIEVLRETLSEKLLAKN